MNNDTDEINNSESDTDDNNLTAAHPGSSS